MTNQPSRQVIVITLVVLVLVSSFLWVRKGAQTFSQQVANLTPAQVVQMLVDRLPKNPTSQASINLAREFPELEAACFLPEAVSPEMKFLYLVPDSSFELIGQEDSNDWYLAVKGLGQNGFTFSSVDHNTLLWNSYGSTESIHITDPDAQPICTLNVQLYRHQALDRIVIKPIPDK